MLSPGAPRATPTQAEAEALGFKIFTFPTGMLSPAIAAMQSGLEALAAGGSEAAGALPQARFREVLGYGAYDESAKAYLVE